MITGLPGHSPQEGADHRGVGCSHRCTDAVSELSMQLHRRRHPEFDEARVYEYLGQC